MACLGDYLVGLDLVILGAVVVLLAAAALPIRYRGTSPASKAIVSAMYSVAASRCMPQRGTPLRVAAVGMRPTRIAPSFEGQAADPLDH